MEALFVSSFASRNPSSSGRPATLLCLHGIEGHGLRFVATAALLPEFTVVAPDLRGHGQSPKDGPWSIAQHIHDLTLLLDSLAEPIVIVGIPTVA